MRTSQPTHPRFHPTITDPFSAGCEEVMSILDECHARGFIHKALGNCNDAKNAVNACLRAERLDRTAKNRELARVQRQRVERRWKEIDENS